MAAGGVGAASLFLTKGESAARGLLRPAAVKSVTGATLPANAAPLSQQYFVSYNNSVGATYKCLDSFENTSSGVTQQELWG